MDTYSVSKVWQSIRQKNSQVNWYIAVWKGPNIPKHSFISWLAATNNIVTNSDISHWGLVRDVNCLLCDKGIDELEHIFLHCSYICYVRNELGPKYESKATWKEELESKSIQFAGDSNEDKVGRATWRAIIAETWYCRCAKNAGEARVSAVNMVQKIKNMLNEKCDVPA
ncbi:hypothetical protein LINPERPRIM_LOCUS4856 [Linum perenne]